MRYIYFIFAVFDMVALSSYFVHSIFEQKIPFFSDLLQLSMRAEQFGDYLLVYSMELPYYLLYSSFFISIWGYLTRTSKIKYLVLIQIPLRILSVVSTIPFLDMILTTLDIFSPLCLFITITSLEITKSIYCFRYKM